MFDLDVKLTYSAFQRTIKQAQALRKIHQTNIDSHNPMRPEVYSITIRSLFTSRKHFYHSRTNHYTSHNSFCVL